MGKKIPISEDSIIAMLKGLPENALMEIFSRTLVRSDTSRLGDEEGTSYKEALQEHEKGDTINWKDFK